MKLHHKHPVPAHAYSASDTEKGNAEERKDWYQKCGLQYNVAHDRFGCGVVAIIVFGPTMGNAMLETTYLVPIVAFLQVSFSVSLPDWAFTETGKCLMIVFPVVFRPRDDKMSLRVAEYNQRGAKASCRKSTKDIQLKPKRCEKPHQL